MREILFRGKRKDTGEWVYGYFVSDGDRSYIFTKEEITKGLDLGGYLDCCQMYEVYPETVSQYIGARDILGQKVFEGDVFECLVHKLYYPHGYFYAVPSVNDSILHRYNMRQCRVVGNIHDNPELLEVK